MKSWQIYAVLALVMALLDIAMTNLALAAAYYLRFELPVMPFLALQPRQEYTVVAVVESAVFPLVFHLRGLYHFRRNPSRIDELQKVFTSVSIGSVASWAIIAFLARGFSYSRALLVMAWGLAVVLIWIVRLLQFQVHSWLMSRGLVQERVIIVGTGEMAQAISRSIQSSPGWGYNILGFVANGHTSDAMAIDGKAVLGRLEYIDELVSNHRASEVIVADPSLSHPDILHVISKCTRSGVSIKVFPDVFQIISSEVAISDINGMPIVNVRDAALRGWRLAVKRAVDVVLSAIILVMLSPMLLLVALLIKLTSPLGPVFYLQERVGLDGKPFQVVKFRSMRTDAEVGSGPVWATQRDPRATSLGRFLRRFSIDELPQFVNVLIGDMSIVGPRPERPHFVEQFSQSIPRYPERHREKVGLTGWAQVNGLRGDTSIEERTAYDLWYVENWTLWLDFKIMLRTFIAIFRESNG